MSVYLVFNRSDRPQKTLLFFTSQRPKNAAQNNNSVADFKCAARSTRVKKMA
jgi:hypothetical protein